MPPVRLTFASSDETASIVAESAAEALVMIAIRRDEGFRLIEASNVETHALLSQDEIERLAALERTR